MTDEGILRVRRYYLRKRITVAKDPSRDALEGVFRDKQEAMPADALPPGFPFAERLGACGYSTIQDVHGASEAELWDLGFARWEALVILTEIAKIAPDPDPPVVAVPT